jgi:serine/threonine protein kinase
MTFEHWWKVDHIACGAMTQHDAARTAFLDDACQGDGALRRAVEVVVARLEGRTRSSHDPLIGERLGDFTIQERIGEGGMGSVYRALQESPARSVALKVMRFGVTSPDDLQRFRWEAEILASLTHPGIAEVFASGILADDRGSLPWFALEYIPDAQSITAFCRDQKLDLANRLSLMIELCHAVHHGHQRGVIHRDLKPANVLIGPSHHPKVIDYGVARVMDSSVSPAIPGITEDHGDHDLVIGTMQYMSPEQLMGTLLPDARSDIYALGVILYELLAGRPPHDIHHHSMTAAMERVTQEDPIPLSRFAKHLRGDLEQIVHTAIATAPGDRYLCAADLGEDLRRFLAKEPIQVRPPTLLYHVGRFAARNKIGFAAIVSVAAVILLSVSVVTTLAVRLSDSAIEIDQLDAQATSADDRATGLHRQGEAVEAFLKSVALGEGGTTIDPAASLDAARQAINDGDLTDQPLLEARLHRSIADMAAQAGRHGEAITALQKSADLLTVHGTVSDAARTRLELASALHNAGDTHAAIATVERVIQSLSPLRSPDDLDLVDAFARLAGMRRSTGAVQESLAIYQSVELALGHHDPSNPRVLTAKSGYAATLLAVGRYQEAAEMLSQLTTTMEVLGQGQTPKNRRLLGLLATCYSRLGRNADADTLFEQVTDPSLPVTPSTLAVLVNYTTHLHDTSRPQIAHDIARRSVTLHEEILGRSHMGTVLARSNLASILRTLGHTDESRDLGIAALNDLETLLPSDHSDLLAARGTVGGLYRQEQEYAKALPIYEKAMAQCLSMYGPSHVITAQCGVAMSEVLTGLGRFNDALVLLNSLIASQGDAETTQRAMLQQALRELSSSERPKDL